MAVLKKRIFLADDDGDDLQVFRDVIRDMAPGVLVHTVTDGRKAAEYLLTCPAAERPEVIVLDYNMPFLNGSQVLAALCESRLYDEVPVYIWSSSNASRHINECMTMGAKDYIVKPETMKAFIALVRRFLGQ